MIEFELTDEQMVFREIARDFSEREIRPIADKLDRSENLLADFPWEMVRKGSKLGLRTLSLPKEYGGPELDMLTWLVIIEELGYADIACAKIFSQCWKLSRLLAFAGTREQKDRFLPAFRDDDTFLLSGAQTEPGSGSDSHLPYDAPNAGVMLSAQRVSDHYVLNGRKHFISHAPVAKLLIVVARTDKTVGTSVGTSTFLVPRDTPGLTFGAVHDKVGFRIYLQGEINFDNVRLPAESLLGGREGNLSYEGVASNIELAAYAVVVARAAFDAAIKHTNESTRGGRQLMQQQAISTKIADMYKDLEAARTLLWRSTWMAVNKKADRSLTMSAKVFCTEVAVKICVAALEIFGGSGVIRDLPIQKYVRDAVALPHMDATNPINKIKIAKYLESWIAEGRLPEWGRSTSKN
jgi:alkylation response protein AidB-like acyl-CoA dehydrogenase